MLEKFQSETAIYNQINHENFQYFLLIADNLPVGYIAFHINETELFLSKVYLLDEYRGKGIIRQAFEFIFSTASSLDIKLITLTVNKDNIKAQQVYSHFGFKNTKAVVNDIGCGYFMDDYIMTKIL